MTLVLYLIIGFAFSLYLCEGISEAKSDHVIITLVYPVVLVGMVFQALGYRIDK